ncbi:MAG: hypothetical protein ABW161_19255, partial [Candidatus Thiodiazotropha sp.]
MNLFKRSYFINPIQVLILFLISSGGLVHGGWLEVISPNRPAPSLVLKDINGKLDKNGDPPALLGRHQQFDRNRSLIVTPKR